MNKKIQILRGIAIIAVIAIHTVGGTAVALRPCVNFAVPLFIFISGYLTAGCEINNMKNTMRRRIKRVVIPFIIWSIIYTLLFGSIENLFYNLATAKASYQLYYIFVYIQLTLVTPILLNIRRRFSKYIVLSVQPLSVLLLRYIMPFLGIKIDGYICSLLLTSWLTFYYMGILIGKGEIKVQKPYAFFIISMLTQYAEEILWHHFEIYDMVSTQIKLSSMICSICVICFAANFLQNDDIRIPSLFGTILEKIGNCSFGIYLTHVIFIEVLKRMDFNIFPINTIMSFIAFIVLIWILKSLVKSKKVLRWIGFV